LWNVEVVVWTFTTINSYWVSHASSENHCETRKSLKISHLFNINQEQVYRTKILDVDELKWRITNDWAALSHTVIQCADGEWLQHLRACVRTRGGPFEHIYCNKDDAMWPVWLFWKTTTASHVIVFAIQLIIQMYT